VSLLLNIEATKKIIRQPRGMKRGIMRGCGVCAAMFWLLLKITS
jgi:hypothetical protein